MVSLGLLYSWASPEYVLWNMDFAQAILYHNKGIEMKYGKEKSSKKLSEMSHSELVKIREDLRKQYGEIDG